MKGKRIFRAVGLLEYSRENADRRWIWLVSGILAMEMIAIAIGFQSVNTSIVNRGEGPSNRRNDI